MRLGITLGGGFSPGPSKIFLNNSSLVAIISHSRQKSINSVQGTTADINSIRLAPYYAQLRWIITSLACSHIRCRVGLRLAPHPRQEALVT